MIGNRTMYSHDEWQPVTGAVDRKVEWHHGNILHISKASANSAASNVFLPTGNASNAYGWLLIVNTSDSDCTISQNSQRTDGVVNTVEETSKTLGNSEAAICHYVPYLDNSPVNGKFPKKVAGDKRGKWVVVTGLA